MNMKYITKPLMGLLLILLILGWSVTSYSQATLDLRINEILQYNDSNLQDDYGQHNPWIEVFNSAYNTVDMGGLYLTNDPANLTKYLIPKGDPSMVIAPRSYLIFWADDNSHHGVSHLNFHLEESSFIAIVDANGKTIIDSLTIPPQKNDITYGRRTDGENVWVFLKKSTPKSNNYTDYIEPPAEKFVKLDPRGFGLTMVSMTVVFFSLILLYMVFKTIARAFSLDWKRRSLLKKGKIIEAESIPVDTSGEINAAIVMALHLYMSQLHDHEQTVLTIKKISRTYSPWSSKIYGLRRYPR